MVADDLAGAQPYYAGAIKGVPSLHVPSQPSLQLTRVAQGDRGYRNLVEF
jgi:hypothetical protein